MSFRRITRLRVNRLFVTCYRSMMRTRASRLWRVMLSCLVSGVRRLTVMSGRQLPQELCQIHFYATVLSQT